MARMVKNTEKQVIVAEIITRFSDGTSSTKSLKPGDIVENLRYVKNEEVVSISGRVSQITTSCAKVTKVNTKKVEDYFSKDVQIKNIIIDASEQYQSKLITVPAKEIVEDEGLTDVIKMDIVAHPIMTMDMEYTDGSIVNQELEVGDVITDTVILNDGEKLTGTYKIRAFYYRTLTTSDNISGAILYGVYLVPVPGTAGVVALFKNFISFTEQKAATVTDSTSMRAISTALTEAVDGKVTATLDVDVTIPKRSDGKITTTMINAGQELTLDLNNHNIDCQAYAFYVYGGTLNIVGDGKITPEATNNAYPTIMVASGGVCNMKGGTIDTTGIDTSDGSHNWIYGVACSGDGVFNMTGGEMKMGGAAGVSITNGTASGEGAKFNIGGDARIYGGETGIYLADNKSIDVYDNAIITNGILLRMGDLTVRDNAKVYSQKDASKVAPLGSLVTFSGCDSHNAAILALTGIYGSSLGNDLNIVIKDNAKVVGSIDNAIDIATINTKYDQKVTVDIESKSNISAVDSIWNIYNHDQLAEMAAEQGKTLAAETKTTDLTVTIAGETVYPEAE